MIALRVFLKDQKSIVIGVTHSKLMKKLLRKGIISGYIKESLT